MRLSSSDLAEARFWAVRLRDEAATDADLAAFELWLAADPVHEEAFSRLDEVLAIAPDAHALAQGRRRVAFQSRRAAFAGIAAAAAAALVAIGFGLVSDDSRVTYATIRGEQRTIELSDGSTIILNTDTALSVRFSADARLIELEGGEAFFEVAGDARPFIVDTDDTSVRAHGTQFSVRQAHDLLCVLVSDGSVTVTTAEAIERLLAGQRYVREGAGKQVSALSPQDVRRHLAWRGGWLEFTGQPLTSATEEVARYTGAHFVIDDPLVREMRITARVRVTDLDRFLQNVDAAQGLRIERRGQDVHIARSAED